MRCTSPEAYVNDILPQGKQDLYCGVLHEIGHALGLNHCIDLGVNGNLELMHWSQLPGQSGGTPTAGRKTLSSAGGNSSAGAFVDIISYSRGLNPSACTDLNPLTTRLISSPSINPASPIVVCTGSSISLTSSAVNSSTVGNLIANAWSTGATTQSITVGGSTATYTVTITQNSTCPVSANRIVTVAGTSIISTQPVNTSICTGGATFFSCSSIGATFQWQRSINSGAWADVVNGSFHSGTTNSTLNILQAQYYAGSTQQYRCLVTQTGLCATASNVVTLSVTNVSLNPSVLPSVYTGSPSFTISGGNPAGGSYSGTGVSGTLFAPPATAGNYTITYTKSGCVPGSASQTIQVVTCNGTYSNCLKSISTNDVPLAICINGSPVAVNVIFTAMGCAYNIGNIFTAQLSDPTGSFASPTTIGSLSATGGGFASCTGTINANIPVGLWGSSYRIRVVSNNPPVIGSANLYGISIDNFPCDANSMNEVGRKSLIESDIKIYPNPAHESFLIELPFDDLSFHVSVYDIEGREVISQLIEQRINQILTGDLNQGLFIVKLTNDRNTITRKLLILK